MNLAVDFKVVAVSSNTNSFGLFQCVMIAKDGLAYKACANSLNIPKQGDIVSIKFIKKIDGTFSNKLDFAGRFEIPERIEDAPKEVRDEVWK